MHGFETKHFLVSGGAGFVGGNLVRRLLDMGAASIHIVDNLMSAELSNVPSDNRVFFSQASIADDSLLNSLNDRYDYVFHLSTYHGNQSSIHDPIADHDNNLITTLKLFNRIRGFRNIRKIVYAGAGCAVAEKTFDAAEATREDAPISLQMDSPYSISKIVGEFYAVYFFNRHGLPTVRARFQNVYGPGEILGAGQWRGTPATVWRNVTPTFIYKALKGESLPLEGGGKASRDFIFVEDIVDGLLACARMGRPGEVYNLASGRETSILTLAEMINELTGNPSPVTLLPGREWDHSGKRFGSTDKAMKEIGFSAKTCIREGLKRTIEWTVGNMPRITSSILKHESRLEGLAGYRSPLAPDKIIDGRDMGSRRGTSVTASAKSVSPLKIRTLYLEINDKDPNIDRWKPLSYIIDWRDAFLGYPELDVELCNINDDAHYSRCLREIGNYELIVVSHAATGDDMTRLLETQAYFAARKGKMAVFIGNEYDILNEKISFIKSTGADCICTQLPVKTAQWLYGECPDARIVAMPHALNPRNYYPLQVKRRPIDIGFIGDIYFIWVGDIERTVLIEFFRKNGASVGLNCDIRTQRVPLDQWNVFLNNCKGIIGAESGSYYLNGRGDLLRLAKEYMEAHPATTFRQLHAMFFQGMTSPVSGKAISSRHFEPIGTKTCQLLLEGDYNGILKADEHYILIKKDYSNIVEAIEKFKDDDYRNSITSRAFDHVMSYHTHSHRIAHMLDQMGR